MRSCSNARCAPGALNGKAGRAFHFSALSSNQRRTPGFQSGNTGATPVEATNFLKEAPVVDPKPEYASALSDFFWSLPAARAGRG